MTSYLFVSLALWFVGAQVQLSELRLLSGHYNYRLGHPQWVTFAAAVLCLLTIVADVLQHSLVLLAAGVLPLLVWYALGEWLLSLWSPVRFGVALFFRLMVVMAACVACYMWLSDLLLAGMLAGLYLRNSPFGVVYGRFYKNYCA